MSRKTRKLIWSVPLVAVLAVVGALAIFAAQPPSGASADGLLGKVMLEQPEAVGPRSIKLTWSPPSGATPTGYRIDVSVTGTSPHAWKRLVANQSGTEYTHMLKESEVMTMGTQPIKTQRYYRVFALNSHGPGMESDIKLGMTKGVSAPEPVTKVTATSMGPNAVKVMWEEPEENGGMSITEYRVVRSDTSSGGTAAADITGMMSMKADADARSITIPKLMADTQFYFRVYAMNKVGYGGVGVPDGAKTAKAGRPDPPTNLVALQSDDEVPTSAINLYWLEPAKNGGRPVTSYVVEYKVGSFQRQMMELTPGTTTDFRTAATVAQDYALTIGDKDPVTTGDQALEEGDKVRILVKSKHADATSRGSREATVTILATDTTATPTETDPRPVAPDPVAASTDSDTPGRIQLSWTHTLRTGYRIDVSEDGMKWMGLESSTNLKVEPLTDGTRRYTHEGLTPGDNKYYRVFPSDGGVFGIAGISGMGTAGAAQAPAAPTASGFTATPASATQINLAWSKATSTGGRDVRRYLLEIDDAPFTTDELGAVTTNDAELDASDMTGAIWVSGTSYMHKGLEPDMRYYYRLRTDNSVPDGSDADADDDVPAVITEVDTNGMVTIVGTITPVKDAAQQTAKTLKHAAPTAPHSLSADQGVKTSSGERGDQGVYLTWLAADTMGGPVEEYEIVRMVADEDDMEIFVPAMGSDARTFYNDDDSQASLDNRVRSYRVRAVSEAGESDWTPWVTYPLGTHTHNMAPTKVGTIADMTVMAGQMSTPMDVSTYFNDAEMDDLTYTATSNMEMYATAAVSGSMLTITGVAEGEATITVTATDMDGAMATQTFMVTVEAADTTPMAPTEVMAEIGGDPGQPIIVNWTDGANAEAHGVILFTSDFSAWPHIARGMNGTHTFTNVSPGSYVAVVVVLDADGGLVTDADGNYLYAGAESVVTVQ